jgi:hypothetical protein
MTDHKHNGDIRKDLRIIDIIVIIKTIKEECLKPIPEAALSIQTERQQLPETSYPKIEQL